MYNLLKSVKSKTYTVHFTYSISTTVKCLLLKDLHKITNGPVPAIT